MKMLIVTALKEEARHFLERGQASEIARPTPQSRLYHLQNGAHLLCSGMGLQRMGSALAGLTTPPAWERVLLTGVSGGVVPDISIGTFIHADRYLGPDSQEIYPPQWEPKWLPAFTATHAVKRGAYRSYLKPVTTVAERERAADLGALAVDMESLEVAAYCHRHELPLLSLRIVSDLAGESAFEEFKKHFKGVAAALQASLIPYLFNN